MGSRIRRGIRIRIASREFVVLSNPETVAKILRDRPDGFGRTNAFQRDRGRTRRSAACSPRTASRGSVSGPWCSAGSTRRTSRRFFPTLSRVTQRLTSRWHEAAKAQAGPIDLQADLMRYTVDVTAGLALRHGHQHDRVERKKIIQEHLDKILPALFKRTPGAHSLPGDSSSCPTTERSNGTSRHCDAVVQASSPRRDARLDEGAYTSKEHPTNLIEAMLVTHHEKERRPSRKRTCRGNVLTMLLAGEDTTANTLAWMIWLLHGKPQTPKSQGHGEVRALLGGAPPTGRPRAVEPARLHRGLRPRNDAAEAGGASFQGSSKPTATRESGGSSCPAGTRGLVCLLRPDCRRRAPLPDAEGPFAPSGGCSGVVGRALPSAWPCHSAPDRACVRGGTSRLRRSRW